MSAPHQSLNRMWKEQPNARNQARSYVQEYRANPSIETQKKLDRIRDSLSAAYLNRWALSSESIRGQFVEGLRASVPVEAAFALLTFLRPEEVPIRDIPAALQGMIRALLFDHTITGDSAKSALEALVGANREWVAFIAKAKLDTSTAEKEFSDRRAQIRELIEEQSSTFKTRLLEYQQQFENIKKVYDEELALQEPVTYWDNKARVHRNNSIYLAIAWFAAAAGTAWVVWWEIGFLIVPYSTHEEALRSLNSQFWRFAVIAATGALLIWVLRILARLLLSDLHLRTDAEERVTMAKTYLALQRSKQGLPDNDRRLILETLFRPSGTGIVPDDSAPASAMQLLSRILSGGKH